MEKVIISQNKHWEKAYSGLYERNIFSQLLANLETKHIQILQGIRRSGKSSLFKLLINHLRDKVNPQQILYINLDDPFFTKYSNDPKGFYEIIQTAQKLTQQKIKYLFLDEVQAVLGWEKYVKSVYDSEEFEKIFITGSNSSLLNSKYASLLTGRYLSNKVYPLNFREILKINEIDTFLELNKQLSKVLKIIDDMMKYGSFVEVYKSSEAFKREILTSYYDTILLKDALQNSGVRDVRAFKDLAYYALSNLTSLYSYSSLSKAVKITDRSAKDYVLALNECYLFNEIKLFSYSLKEQINNKKKLYLSDNGFMDLAFSFSNNYGKLFENLVFTELQKQNYDIYFYNKEIECDFIAKKEDKLIAIQVCYELNEHNQAREFNGLLKLPFTVDEKYIITYNQNENTINDDVKVVRFWEYFG
ncbi:ATP-binding protein [Phocoenobacter skyensis]|uniref:ATP-binding protein n=1 Tax=Phocoenobacter skyensis TaxID=97481 RepID=A0A1H7Y6C8_9PAST|nr:ATP-binding protein [Pasteurella skyensis]MDP8079935.1 ATP-binding protein [Pasteurella skyensis]MDP8085831.1 ATP-binding protein [Pasteurella skyensis]MDP8171569.1 ATP-binding protein [Pasteurella skyensis]MDP8175798.1 ATP-binding protein [Pasteurella skyensis]MDP8185725.1 ATP-binding protein [Pasteurella skyensis]